jgi:hypothetical protein
VFYKLLIILFLAFTLLIGAEESAKKEEIVSSSLAAYEKGDHSSGQIAILLPYLADPARRSAVKARLSNPFPSAELVQLLQHPSLAVRLGALELLEEQATGDFSFNPWNAPDLVENTAPLARWADWAAKGSGTKNEAIKNSLLGDDQRRGYLRELLGQDNDKASRARQMLEADGLSSVSFLEEFLTATPALTAGARAQIRQAQYQIVLAPAVLPSARAINCSPPSPRPKLPDHFASLFCEISSLIQIHLCGKPPSTPSSSQEEPMHYRWSHRC